MPRIVKFTQRSTGKKYEMPWDKETDPSPFDLADFVDKQERPSTWDRLNTPLTDMPSRAAKYLGSGLDVNESDIYSPFRAGVKGFAQGALQGAGDLASSFTSPLSAALTALTLGGGTAAKVGLGGLAKGAQALTRVAGAGMAGHGLIRAGQGAYNLDPAEAFGGIVEAAGGGLGMKAKFGQVPQKGIGAPPNVRTGVPTGRGRFIEGESPHAVDMGNAPRYSVEDLGNVSPGEQFPREPLGLPPVSDRGLPPRGRTFYGGPSGGSLGTEVGEPATRTFRGGPGTRPPDYVPPRNWSTAQGKLRPTTPLSEAPSVGPVRDILEQNSPYGRSLKQKDFASERAPREGFHSAEPVIDADVVSHGGPEKPRPFAKANDSTVSDLANLGDKNAIAEAKLRPTLRDALKHLFLDEAGVVGKGRKKDGPGKRLEDVVAERAEKEKPSADMFDRGELDDKNPFSYKQFLSDMKTIVKKGARKLKGEKGFIVIKDKPHEEAKANAKEWIFKRQAAMMHGKIAMEKTQADPGYAHKIIGELWQEQKDAGRVPHPISGISPEHVRDYVIKAKTNIANQEFRDWMEYKGYLDKNRRGPDVTQPEGASLKKWMDNHFQEARDWSKVTGGTADFTKNIYLAGGIPKTILNMHGYNIGRSDVLARGFKKGTKSFVEGVFNSERDKQVLAKHRDLIPEAMEKGFVWHDIEGHSPEGRVEGMLAKSKAGQSWLGNKALKGVAKTQEWFEDPLFKRYLPARKLEFLAEKTKQLQSAGLDRGEALTRASKMANDFYGGVEKVLRDKTGVNTIKAIALAPDWFESRMKLGYKGLKALAGKEDVAYAKAIGRATAMRLTRDAVIILGGGSLLKSYAESKPGDVTSIPLGETSDKKKNRELPTLGTAGEVIRLTEEGLHRAYKGSDPGFAFEMLKNRASQPFTSGVNLLFNRDEFGNPLYGQGKFGKPIGWKKGLFNIADQATRPIQPQQLQALIDKMQGNIENEEAIAKGLELPLKYSSKRTFGQVRRNRSRRSR